jgi:hypothetical protein
MPYTYQRPPRPFRAVSLPGGGVVHVRGLSLADLRRVDEAVANAPPHLVAVRTIELLAVRSLVGEKGEPVYVGTSPAELADDLADVAELLTPDQLDAVAAAACGRGKAEQGKG